MSLSKQLGLGFFFVLLISFLGTLWMNTQNTRSFIEQQLNSHAQDTATSLGLSISPYIGDDKNLAVIETMINAIFDRGYYRSITLYGQNGETLIEKRSNTHNKDIPQWFTQRFPIAAPTANSEINDGWSVKASLKIVSNPGLGYQQLWQSAVQSLIVTLVALTLAILFVWYLVKRVISLPINRVIEQAESISKKQFEQIEIIPTTKELYGFVNAINIMSEKLFVMFKKMTNQSEEYRRFAYVDFVTGVGNRRAFELAIKELLSDAEKNSEGFLFIIRASSLKEIHTNLGGEAGDKYLKSVCMAIKEAASAEYDHFSLYRVNGADFALIIENLRESHAKAMAQLLSIYTKRLEKNEHKNGVAHIGATHVSLEDNYKEVMHRVDSALLNATSTEQRWEISSQLSVSHSNEEWRDTLSRITQDNHADFVSQKIIGADNETLYCEWFARLLDNQSKELVPMVQLIPASIRLDFAQQIDKLIIQNIFVKASESEDNIGINVSRISLFDGPFIEWFIDKLKVYRSTCHRITLEIPERALVHDIEALATLTKQLKSYGMNICIEHFGAQLAGITHIRKIMPDYLKIDGRFTRAIDSEIDNQLFVKSLINIAHGLDIKIIAEKIESKQEYKWLIDNGIDGVQGYYVAGPKPVDI